MKLPPKLPPRRRPPDPPASGLTDPRTIEAVPAKLGEVLDPASREPIGEEFVLEPHQWMVHMAVLGNSGGGKSKFLELFFRHRLVTGQPFALWDPHGDLAKNLLAFVAAMKASGDDRLWRTVHYLTLTPEAVYAYDPVLHAPDRRTVGDNCYFQWMRTRINRLVRAVLRRLPEASQDIVVRLKRWMTCVFWACLVSLDDANTHVGLDKALVFTDPDDADFPALWARVRDVLPRRVRRTFEKLIAERKDQNRERWVESTINKLEDILSPLLELVYSQQRESIDVRGIVQRGEFLLIDLKEGEFFSHEEKVALGGFLLVDVMAAKEAEESLPEDERREYMVAVDEANELLGSDIPRWLRSTRKYRVPIVLGAQGLAALARGELDVAADVMVNCGAIVCFQNTWGPDKEVLADRMFGGNVDFTRRMVEVQRQRGLRVLTYDEWSESFSEASNWSRSKTVTESRSHAHAVSQALALSNQFSNAVAQSDGTSRKGMLGLTDLGDVTRSGTETSTRSDGGGKTKTEGLTDTETAGLAVAEGETEGGAATQGLTVAHKIVVQPNVVSEFEEDGSLLAGTVEQQDARHRQVIHTLGVGMAAVAVRGRAEAFVIQVDRVEEWWTDGREKYEAIRRIEARLRDLHGYYFMPPKRTALPPVAAAGRERDDLDGPVPDAVVEENGYGN